MREIGEKIKQYRHSIKMTQSDFATRLGITGASVSAYENGTRLPSYEVLVKIANILGVTTDDLLGRSVDHAEMINAAGLTAEQKDDLRKMVEIYRGFNYICQQAPPEMKQALQKFMATGVMKEENDG